MIQIMKMDVRLQNAEDYYQFIKRIRGDEKVFQEMVGYLKANYKLVKRTAKEDLEEIEGKFEHNSKKKVPLAKKEALMVRSRVESDQQSIERGGTASASHSSLRERSVQRSPWRLESN